MTDTHDREARARALAEGIGGKVSPESSGEWLVFVSNGDASLCFAFDEFSTPHNPVFGWSVFDEQGVQIRAVEAVVPHLTAHDMDACIAKAKAIIAAEMPDTTDTATQESEALRAIAGATDGHLGPSGMNCIVVLDRHQIVFGFDGGTLGWDINTLAADGDWDHYESVTTTLTPTTKNLDAIIVRCENVWRDTIADPEEREMHAIADGIDGAYVWNSGGNVLLIPVHRKTWSIQFGFVSGTLGWNAVSHDTDEEPDFADGSLLDDGGADLDSSETAACIAYCNKVIAEQDSKRKDFDWWIGEDADTKLQTIADGIAPRGVVTTAGNGTDTNSILVEVKEDRHDPLPSWRFLFTFGPDTANNEGVLTWTATSFDGIDTHESGSAHFGIDDVEDVIAFAQIVIDAQKTAPSV